jgi:hypothetical protein
VASLAPGVDSSVATQGQAKVETAKDPSDLDALEIGNGTSLIRLLII